MIQDLVKQVKIHGDSWIGLEAVTSGLEVKWRWIDNTDTISYR